MTAKDIFQMLKQAAKDWSDDNASRLAAALAYYTIFSLAPMLVIAVVILSVVMRNNDGAKERVVSYFTSFAQGIDPSTVRTMIASASKHGSGTLAVIVATALTLFGAFTFFTNLQASIDSVWEVKPRPDLSFITAMRNRVATFLLVGVIAMLLLVSVGFTTAMTGYVKAISGGTFGKILAYTVDIIGSLGIYTLLFAAIFKYVPDVKVAWRDVWVGGGVTAVLFLIGKYLLSFYLAHGAATSLFGAAGSLAALLTWIYYSAQIFFFGAEFTQVYARKTGRRIEPSDNAIAMTGAERAKMQMQDEKRSGSPTRQPPAPQPPVVVYEPCPAPNPYASPLIAAGGLVIGVAAGVATWLRAKKDPVRHAKLGRTKWRLDRVESRLKEIKRAERRGREIDIEKRLKQTDHHVRHAMRELKKGCRRETRT